MDNRQLSFALEAHQNIYCVTELNAALQRIFESEFRSIRVAGEISGCRVAASGHYYFALKDEHSQIKAVLFKGSARYIRFKPQDGLAVIARGNLEVYEARGEYQLIVEALELEGAGILQLAFEQLKKKLTAEGLFAESRKRALPALPQRIGLVTSPTGAVIRDILHVLNRRFPGLHIRLFPAQVQGEGSIDQICEAIEYFSVTGWAHVVILARGGGSLEDLWTFNEERVARTVANSKVPVISAIGHETDVTICDFVADFRAPTPSAAAEVVICTRESLLERLAASEQRALQGIRYRLLRCARDLHQKGTDRAGTLMHRSLSRRAQRVDELEYAARQALSRTIAARTAKLSDLNRRLEANDLQVRLARARGRLELLEQVLHRRVTTTLGRLRRRHESLDVHLRQISPLTVLSRGYAIVRDTAGRVLRGPEETALGAQLNVRLDRGTVEARVEAVSPNRGPA
ncbi:MAG TPA: exodeoxyribonuclease VII large subunit [Bryobacteraceae bacterium]|jgi:exodeoxyribonuclease VII large subunit|nr:exodeoxyribonuclease VII large subunit [Bryobacteraceae bacterium]